MINYHFLSKTRPDNVGSNVLIFAAEPVIIQALSLKKAIAKFTPPANCVEAIVNWTSRKGNESKKVIAIPHVTRKQRKGK